MHWYIFAAFITTASMNSNAFAVDTKSILKRYQFVGVLSNIGIIKNIDSKKTIMLKEGDIVPTMSDILVEKVAPGYIAFNINGDTIELRFQGRDVADDGSGQSDNDEDLENLDDDSLEYYRRILEAERKAYKKKWEATRTGVSADNLIICNAADDDCPIE